MHGDHRLAIDYDGELILFGRDIVSWEYDEIVHMIAVTTGGTFRNEVPETG